VDETSMKIDEKSIKTRREFDEKSIEQIEEKIIEDSMTNL